MINIKTVCKGAELISIEKDGVQRLHDAQKDWNRHCPVLFPIVGKLKDGKTIINGNTYEMSQHGFARDTEFERIDENSYVLKYNEETLKKYPFKFELYISYKTIGDSVITNYRVKNIDCQDIYFGLGGHPAYVCDYCSGKYTIEFDKQDTNIEVYQLENGLVKNIPEEKSKFLEKNIMHLNENTFANDAIIFKNINTRKVILKKEENTVLEFEFKDFPYLGIWSKPNANFVCLEPWLNTADKVSSNGIYENKENLIKLRPQEEFLSEYVVKFFD